MAGQAAPPLAGGASPAQSKPGPCAQPNHLQMIYACQHASTRLTACGFRCCACTTMQHTASNTRSARVACACPPRHTPAHVPTPNSKHGLRRKVVQHDSPRARGVQSAKIKPWFCIINGQLTQHTTHQDTAPHSPPPPGRHAAQKPLPPHAACGCVFLPCQREASAPAMPASATWRAHAACTTVGWPAVLQ